MALAGHPGTIQFVDGASGKVEKEVDASTVPETIAFYHGAGAPQPVVKIVSFVAEGTRILRSYGVNDQLLTSTTAFTGPQPPRPEQ